MKNIWEQVLVFYTIFGIAIFRDSVICDTSKCREKLLNDYQSVPDSAFSATSYFINQNAIEKKIDFSAKAARDSYDKENEEFAWCPSNEVETSLSEYLQIDLRRLTMIKVVQTRGRFAQGTGKEFTPFYRIRYSRVNGTDWKDYRILKDTGFEKILKGATDAFLDAFESLDPPIIARIFRIFPYSLTPRRVCLKLQLFGCRFQEDILEYNIKQGSAAILHKGLLREKSNNFGALNLFYDNGYDGKIIDGHLYGGVGLLTDYKIGMDINKEKEALNFMGWHQNTFQNQNRFISVRFVFLNRRNFTSLKLYSYSNHSMEIEYFSKIAISFSDDGKTFSQPVDHDNLIHLFNRVDHFITININGAVGKFVNITLYFQSSWLLLSEILFISDPIESSVSDISDINHQVKKGDSNGTDSEHVTPDIIYTNSQFDYGTSKPNDKPVSIEIIYLLTILLCLLLAIITAICSFWIIIKKKRSNRRRSIKKQAMALCSQVSFIPYNHNSKSVQCLPNSIATRSVYPSFTVDRINYPNETLRNNKHMIGAYLPQPCNLDQNCYLNKQNNTDSNIYTSIIGSDNDSSLSPEYATTSIINDNSLQQHNFENNNTYLPPPIEPIRPQKLDDTFMDTAECPPFYYPHPNTLSNKQDQSTLNIWRFNSQSNPTKPKGINLSSQMSFNDFSKDIRKINQISSQDNFQNISSIYSDINPTAEEPEI